MEIYKKILDDRPFCFIRINDGETNAIISESAIVSRGDEHSSKYLSEKLLNIICDTWHNDSLFIGVPCFNCYHECYKIIKNELVKSKDITFIEKNVVDANILINNNYNKTLDLLINKLPGKNVIIIGNETTVSNSFKLTEKLGINVSKTFTVASKNAFETDYDKLKNIVFEDKSFIITLCGPLGRVLCYEWYKCNTTLSCLDLGSFFDPLLRNKAYLYHTNNHKYCSNCYPVADSKYSNIFEYCGDVEKECYYLGTFQEHMSLYNKDVNRIILNTKIRLEKEPYNLDLLRLMVCCKVRLFNKHSNYHFGNDSSNFKSLIDLSIKRNPKQILEIGFGASTLLFLEQTNAYITCIDISSFDISYLQSNYNNRLTFINGNSADIVPTLTDIYDLIYIDGSIEESAILIDILNSYYKSTSETYLIINNISENNYNKCILEKIFIPFHEEKYDNTPFKFIASRYNWSNRDIIRQNNLVSKYVGKYEYIISLLNTITDENELKKIITHVEEIKLLKLKKESNEGYAYQVPRQFEDLMNFCHIFDKKKCDNKNKETNILEIGFLHGSTSLMFLLNTSANVTSIDIDLNTLAVQYILDKFVDRFRAICGNSNDMMNMLLSENKKYDIIYVDGSHDYNTVKIDISLCEQLLVNNGYIIMNDIVNDESMSMCWNYGPTKAFNEIDKDITLESIYEKGRGLAIFQFKKKEYLNMNKEEMYNKILNLYESSNHKKLYYLTEKYIDYFLILLTKEELEEIKYYNVIGSNDVTNVENFVISIDKENIDIKNKALNWLNNKYKNKICAIPKIIHLIYLNQRPLKSYNYVCINSIIRHMPTYEIWIHNDIEPDTDEWKKLKSNNNVFIKKIDRITEFDGFHIGHVQYESDIIRMNLLYTYGGIYLDTDVLIIKSIDTLLDSNYGLYIAKETENSLINCVLISEPGNEFINIWLNKFKGGFRMNNWGWHIRDLPKILLEQFTFYIKKYNIKLLDYQNFCPIHWTERHLINDSNFEIHEKIYGIHLYETILGDCLDNSILLKKNK